MTNIIPYNESYFPQYAALYHKTWLAEPYGELFTDDEIEQHLPKSFEYLFLCINAENNQVIAFAGGRPLQECDFFENKTGLDIHACFYFNELGVDENYRQLGLGEKMSNYLTNQALKNGFTGILLRTGHHNDNPAIKFYQKLGFKLLQLSDGSIYGINTRQNRIDNRPDTDFRPYYYRQYPSLQQLQETFSYIKTQSYNGAPSVLKFDTGKEGPVLGITMCTHGDEPAGLAVLWNFMHENLQGKLLCGAVIFVLQNIAATEQYFSMLDSEERNKYRYTEGGVNFNRLPEHSLEIENSPVYEINRLQQLYPVYKEFKYGYDIHTSEDEEPMIITGNQFYPELVKGFPIEKVLTNIAEAQINLPSFSFFGGLNSNIPVFEIEAGTDESPASFKMAIDCSLALLRNLNMLEGNNRSLVTQYQEYFIFDKLVLPNDSFELVKTFDYYENITKDQPLAKGIINGEERIITAAENGHAIFPPLGKLKRDYFSLTEETFFISKPVQTIVPE